MEYLHYFETTSAFTEAYNGGGYVEPWVSYTEEDEKVHYNKTEQEKLLETPLTFEITSDGYINWRKSRGSAKYITIEYSKNGVEWTEITSNTGGTHIDVVSGDTVQFRGNNNTYYLSYNNNSTFGGTTCGFNLCGNIMSLINSTNFSNLTEFPEGTAYNFGNLFISCTGLTDASNLILPATTLAEGCYCSMFQGCTSLVTAPELPATTLADSCYQYMFMGCTSLNYVKCLATDISARICTDYWLQDVSASGTFVKNPNMTGWTTGIHGIPNGWTVVDV